MTPSNKPLWAVLGFLIMGTTTADAAEPANPFDAVNDGVLTVYPIDDLTRNDSTTSADELTRSLDTLIRGRIAADQWTTAGGHKAAMRSTPDHLTVKAAPDVHGLIAKLMGELREMHSLAVRFEYQIVDAADSEAIRRTPGWNEKMMLIDPPVLRANTKTVLAPSLATVRNGNDATLIDGVGLPVPTIKVEGISVSVDRRYVTIALVGSGGPDAYAFRTMNSVPFGQTVAVAVSGGPTRWLLLKPILMNPMTPAKPA
ncbi:MAG TPA: hypothetical protein VF595_15415 [Tepidisphaeraceae bacterium]|jgi:hypothetical protein